MSGHADTAPDSLSDLASFLGDTPDAESPDGDMEHDESDDSTAEGDTEDEESDGQEESEDDESDDEEAEDTPAPERKLKVTVKGDDGTDQEIEVDEAEVVKGYQRQADYTRKTQELAQREHQAVEILKAKHDEFAQDYLSKAEASRAAIVQLAGLKGEDEMAQLAQSDPAAWVAENQRRQSIVAVLGHLDQQVRGRHPQEVGMVQCPQHVDARGMRHRHLVAVAHDGRGRVTDISHQSRHHRPGCRWAAGLGLQHSGVLCRRSGARPSRSGAGFAARFHGRGIARGLGAPCCGVT